MPFTFGGEKDKQKPQQIDAPILNALEGGGCILVTRMYIPTSGALS